MSREKFVAPRCDLFEQDWVFFLSPGAFRALMYLIVRAKQESSQKNPGRCQRMTPKKAAHDWRVAPEDVIEMERAAMEGDEPFLRIEGDEWVVTDLRIFQAQRTEQRQTAWERDNLNGLSPSDDENAQGETNVADDVPNEEVGSVCPTNAPESPPNDENVGRTLSLESEEYLTTTSTEKNPIDPPSGGAKGRGFSPEKFYAWFEDVFKKAYPKRKGGYEWPMAKKKLEALFRAKALHPDCVIEGAKRYSAAMVRDGKFGTELVKQASTWVEKRGWEDDYGDDGPVAGIPATPKTPTRTLTAEERERMDR